MTEGETPDPSLSHYPPRMPTSPKMDWDEPGDYMPRYRARPRAFDFGATLRKAALFIGIAGVIGLGGWGVVAMATRPPAPEKVDAFAPSFPVGFDPTYSLTLCDLNMRAQLVSPNSYRADWQRQIREQSGMIAIRRGFVARNPMGVDVRGAYICLVGASTNRIVGLQYEMAGASITIPGSELHQ